MFIAREKEIAILQRTYDKPGFQMTVIYGRRRIGKSKLITEFIKGKGGRLGSRRRRSSRRS
jgi:AAA+ ATPase superfamily predicted ATPase